MSWFFFICRNFNELFSELPSSASIPKQRLRRWLSVFRRDACLLFIVISIWRQFNLNWATLCVAKFSKASIKADTKWQGLASQTKNAFLYQVRRYRYQNWDMLPNSCCCFGAPGFFISHQHTSIKNLNCHVDEEFLIVFKANWTSQVCQTVYHGADTHSLGTNV